MLCEMTAQGVDQLCALTHQKIARAEDYRPRLLLCGLERHEAHRRPRDRFHDPLCVSCVVLLPFHEGLYIDRRNQPDSVPELLDLAPPVMRRRAGLHRHTATRLRRQKR
jgi:hypothetical protein